MVTGVLSLQTDTDIFGWAVVHISANMHLLHTRKYPHRM